MTELSILLMYLVTVGLAVFIGYRAGRRKGETEDYSRGYTEGRKDGAFWAVVGND